MDGLELLLASELVNDETLSFVNAIAFKDIGASTLGMLLL